MSVNPKNPSSDKGAGTKPGDGEITPVEYNFFTDMQDDYPGEKGDKRIAVKVTDIYENDGLKVIRITL